MAERPDWTMTLRVEDAWCEDIGGAFGFGVIAAAGAGALAAAAREVEEVAGGTSSRRPSTGALRALEADGCGLSAGAAGAFEGAGATCVAAGVADGASSDPAPEAFSAPITMTAAPAAAKANSPVASLPGLKWRASMVASLERSNERTAEMGLRQQHPTNRADGGTGVFLLLEPTCLASRRASSTGCAAAMMRRSQNR